MKDYLGSEIIVGARGIRVAAFSHNKYFTKITVLAVDEKRQYGDTVQVLTDSNSKPGWTYPNRIIVNGSLSVKV